MPDSKIHNTPSSVAAEDGAVIVDGPDGVAVSLTPEAALKTSDRLLEAGTHAHGQNVQKEQDEKKR